MAKTKKKKKSPGRRLVQLILFLVAVAFLFWGRYELLWGLKGYLFDRIDFFRIESQSGLPPQSVRRARPAEVVGIPDYEHALRFPYEEKILTCYRMVDFGNRLVVCSDKGLKQPEAIDEIIKERTIRGRLERLSRSPLDGRLRRVFQKVGDIRLKDDAFLLIEEKSPLPSVLKVCFLSICVLLCCFFAWRVIK